MAIYQGRHEPPRFRYCPVLTPVTHYYWHANGTDASRNPHGRTWSSGHNLPGDPHTCPISESQEHSSDGCGRSCVEQERGNVRPWSCRRRPNPGTSRLSRRRRQCRHQTAHRDCSLKRRRIEDDKVLAYETATIAISALRLRRRVNCRRSAPPCTPSRPADPGTSTRRAMWLGHSVVSVWSAVMNLLPTRPDTYRSPHEIKFRYQGLGNISLALSILRPTVLQAGGGQIKR